jgi:hypothetical protein
MNTKETIRELTADEVEVVNGGQILDFGFFRVAGTVYDGGVALGLEVFGTQYIVNAGSHGVNAWSQPA